MKVTGKEREVQSGVEGKSLETRWEPFESVSGWTHIRFNVNFSIII